MKGKSVLKIIVDVLMSVLVLACMSGLLAGDLLHEVFGTILIVAFIVHNIINWRFYTSLFSGKYTLFRITQVVLNILCLVCMVLQAVSGIILSTYVFSFLNIQSGFSWARKLHLAFGYWTLIFTSIHLGFHWSMIMGKMKWNKVKNQFIVWTLRIVVILISIIGVYYFCKNQLYLYMFLRVHFAFFDFEQPLALFYLQYLAISVLWVTAGFYLKKLITKK